MCTFFFCENVGQLLADLQQTTFKAGKHEDNVTISSMENTVVSSIGIDKRGNNQRRGNTGIHVQCPACLEVPVAECHGDLQLTMFNPVFPLQPTFNDLVSNYYFSLVIIGTKHHHTHCASVSIFKPVPWLAQLTMQDFNVTFFQSQFVQAVLHLATQETIVVLIYPGTPQPMSLVCLQKY